MPYQVKDYMKKKVNTIDESATVTEVAEVMAADEDFEGYVVVLQNGRPWGMATERDIVNQVLARARDPATTKIAEIASTPLITIDPDEDLLTAAQVMHDRNVAKLVVARSNILYGIITEKIITHRCGEYVDQSIKDITRWSTPLGL
jgi:CBS domain-containing protein